MGARGWVAAACVAAAVVAGCGGSSKDKAASAKTPVGGPSVVIRPPSTGTATARPFVSMPPMSMHSIGQAWAHWKHVSHFSVPYSS